MRVLCFGEILLRMSAPGYTRLFQKDSLDVSFCGGEANVAVSLAFFGMDSAFVTKLPDNAVGRAAVNSMRYFGVDCSKCVWGNGRLGTYYLEKGASQRSSKVIYDRKYSDISLADPAEFDWDQILEGYDWFHWTGINPALGEKVAKICEDACKAAKKKGIFVSCDLNYRGNLWPVERAKEVMSSLMEYVDLCIGNEEDADKVLGICAKDNDVESGELNRAAYEDVARQICDTYHCKYVAFTLRESRSASDNGWSAMLYSADTSKAYFSRHYDIHIVDRVGGGDSFSAGIIYGLIHQMEPQKAIDFAAAASCLKHTIEGDFNRVTLDEVEKLMNGGGNGRVAR